jgi:large subunit ribosomal protein L21
MTHAVIKIGGKQYLVQKDDIIKVEKLPEEEGKKVVFKEVLLSGSNKKLSLGSPTVKGASVEGKVLKQARHKKVWGVKMKAKKRQRKLWGHKQAYTEVEITKLSAE